MSDHVPELMYAHRSLSAGHAATAQAVSCESEATTLTLAKPLSSANAGLSGPSVVADWATSGKIERGKSSAPIKRSLHLAKRGL